MSDQLFDVILFPKLKEGADPATVTERLAQLLRIDTDKAAGLVASEKNTRLFRAVTKEQADRFYKAISACGITCNVAPSAGKSLAEIARENASKAEDGAETPAAGEDGLALMPMTEGMRQFKCPNCGHGEEIARSAKIVRCPACNIDVAKALEKQEREEAERRIQQSKAAEEKRRLKQYEERLRIELEKQIRARLEEEIRKELGLSGAAGGGFWGYFLRNRGLVSGAVFAALVGTTVGLTLTIKSTLDAREREALAAAAPTPEVQAIAPVITAAASARSPQVQQNVQTMAQVTNGMAPPQQQIDMQALSAAGITMMKGLDPNAFVAMAATTQVLGNTMAPLAAMGGLPVGGGSAGMIAMAGMTGGAGPMVMGMPGIGNQLGMPGVGSIPRDQFVQMMTGMSTAAPGQQAALALVSGNPALPDLGALAGDQEGADLATMAPEKTLELVEAMLLDREWGRFLASRVGAFAERDADAASDLASRIPTPYERASARAQIAMALEADGLDAASRLMAERAITELEAIAHTDTRAQAAVALGDLLAHAGNDVVAADVRRTLRQQSERAPLREDRATLLGRVAVSHYVAGELDVASQTIEEAVEAASSIPADGLRLRTFLRLAQRYADMSATPVAHTIANESASRARNLAPEVRAGVFVASAKARAYMGDTERAARDVNLVGEEIAKDQALAAIVDHLVVANEPYRAAQFIDAIDDAELAAQLDLELVAQAIADDAPAIVLQRMDLAGRRVASLGNPEVRALMLGRLGRLQIRADRADEARRSFSDALAAADAGRAEARDLLLASIAVDQAYALALGDARRTAGSIGIPAVRTRLETFLAGVENVAASDRLGAPNYRIPEPGSAPVKDAESSTTPGAASTGP